MASPATRLWRMSRAMDRREWWPSAKTRNRVGVGNDLRTVTQGSSCRATLAFGDGIPLGFSDGSQKILCLRFHGFVHFDPPGRNFVAEATKIRSGHLRTANFEIHSPAQTHVSSAFG